MTQTTKFLALLGALLMPLAAFSQDAAPGTLQARETPWQVTCEPVAEGGTLACAMAKNLTLSTDNSLLAQASVLPDGDGYLLRILAPHGLLLSDGLTLSVDGNMVARPAFRTSLPAGVTALVPLTPELIAALGTGEALTITATQNNAATFTFQMTLTGFSASLAKLK
ncbi:MAG: invasion associated locus B family protein [Deltaproteobacteria bacterium]